MAAYAVICIGVAVVALALAKASANRLEEERVRNHLNGTGNGDVYADVREAKPVFVHLEGCEESQMDDLEKRLIDAFHATESYNSTRGGARRR